MRVCVHPLFPSLPCWQMDDITVVCAYIHKPKPKPKPAAQPAAQAPAAQPQAPPKPPTSKL